MSYLIASLAFPSMAFSDLPVTLLIVTFFISLYFYLTVKKIWNDSFLPMKWPFLGMLPSLFQHFHKIHDFATGILIETGGACWFKGPWFTGSDFFMTSDPSNVDYVMNKNSSNYPKSAQFIEIFDIFGDGIINAEPKLWGLHRKTTMALFTHTRFHHLLEKTIWKKIETGFIPLLENLCHFKATFDLQDLFQRFSFDNSFMLLLDHDPGSLSINLPVIPCEKAFSDVSAALLLRYILPRSIWKLQRWLWLGKEKKLIEAWDAFDEFMYPCISMKMEELNREIPGQKSGDFNLLATFLKAFEGTKYIANGRKKFMRDTFINLMLAGRDTTSTALTWLFYLLSKHPEAESKILDEITTKFNMKDEKDWISFTAEETHQLVYLHGAFCETLRLFPSVPWQHQSPVKPDLLPSGHHIGSNVKVLISYYAMGRAETIWGKDCLEFRPERWISKKGEIVIEPSFKFPAFNAGPRACIGKEMAFIQMKMVAASILFRYHVQVVKDHPVSPGPSIIIQMPQGLKVRLSKRSF